MTVSTHVELKGLTVHFGSKQVLNSLSCAFPKGEISVLLGGSGVGKSTTLGVIAGLTPASGGSVQIDGQDVTRLIEREWAAVRRKVGMLFQGSALLDSLSVNAFSPRSL